ncbi:MAG: acetyltransferase [Gammaproteobacteria bacterium]
MNENQSNPFQGAKPDFQRLYIFGAGGAGREIAWLVKQAWGAAVEIVFVVDDARFLLKEVHGYPMSLLANLELSSDARYLVALGDSVVRQRIALAFERAGYSPAILVHPRAELSQWVKIGGGSVIYANCVITCDVVIGSHVQINVGCTVSHDTVIGDYSTLSPGVHVPGRVLIGRHVFVGTNACFINGESGKPLSVGEGAVIAAGACVTKDVPPGVLVAGVPAIIKRQAP